MNDVLEIRRSIAERAEADVREFCREHDVVKDPALLFGDWVKLRLLRMRNNGEERLVKLFEEWKAAKVPRLPDLRLAIKKLGDDHAKKKKLERIEGKDGFVRDPAGKIIADPANIRTAVAKLGVALSYDAFRGQPTVSGLPDGFGPALDDAAMNRLWLLGEEQFQFLPPAPLFQTVASDLCQLNRFHPVREHLDWLQWTWDGQARLDTWLVNYAKAKDTPYTRAVGAIVMMAAVRRVRQPGVKFDEMLILESAEQGLNKSSLVAAMACREEWFTDSLPLAADDKTMIERTSGKWIIEVGELQGMRKGEIEKMRAQMSRQTDRARLAYARLPTDHPRQFILIGTTNSGVDAPYLADIAGNRRYWPVEVGRCDLAAFIRDREQLWGEAAFREARGDSIRLPEQLWAEAGAEQSSRAVGNTFVDVLGPILGNKQGFMLPDDIWKLLHIPPERRVPHTAMFGRALKELGWERRQRRVIKGRNPVWTYSRGKSRMRLVAENDLNVRGGLVVRHAGDGDDACTEE